MREILFKAKRIDNGEWVEGWLFLTKDNTYIAYTSQFDDDLFLSPQNIFIAVDIETICQYTGLTDKNGNKIWENDVVKVDVDRAIAMYSEKHSGYILQPIGDYYFDSPMLVDNVDIIDKVIGNIFENPKLMKGSEEE